MNLIKRAHGRFENLSTFINADINISVKVLYHNNYFPLNYKIITKS